MTLEFDNCLYNTAIEASVNFQCDTITQVTNLVGFATLRDLTIIYRKLKWTPRPRLTNGFSIAIQIWLKFCFILTLILIRWPLQSFVHVLTWHVENFVAIWSQATELQRDEISIEFELRAKNVSETSPWILVWEKHRIKRNALESRLLLCRVMSDWDLKYAVTTLTPRQMDAISQMKFSNGFPWMKVFEFSLRFVPKGPINKIPALVQIMAWRRPGDKPLS